MYTAARGLNGIYRIFDVAQRYVGTVTRGDDDTFLHRFSMRCSIA